MSFFQRNKLATLSIINYLNDVVRSRFKKYTQKKTDDGDDDSKTKKEVKCSMAKSDHLGRYLIYIICEQVSECV